MYPIRSAIYKRRTQKYKTKKTRRTQKYKTKIIHNFGNRVKLNVEKMYSSLRFDVWERYEVKVLQKHEEILNLSSGESLFNECNDISFSENILEYDPSDGNNVVTRNMNVLLPNFL